MPRLCAQAPFPKVKGHWLPAPLSESGARRAGLLAEDTAAAVEGKVGAGRTLGVSSLASQGLVHGSLLTQRTMPGSELSC